MSRPVQNHLDSYKMYNQILQCLLILLINFILYLNINLKNILKIFTPRPPPPTKSAAKSFSSDLSLDAPVRPGVSKHDLLEEPGAGACHIIFREFSDKYAHTAWND